MLAVNRAGLDSTSVPFYAGIKEISRGAVQAAGDSNGHIALPVSGSTCGELSGTGTKSLVEGVASFGNLAVTRKGDYFLRFTASLPSLYWPSPRQLLSVDSSYFVVTATATNFVLSELYFLKHPDFALSATPLGQQPKVELRDSLGARLKGDDTTDVIVSLGLNHGGKNTGVLGRARCATVRRPRCARARSGPGQAPTNRSDSQAGQTARGPPRCTRRGPAPVCPNS